MIAKHALSKFSKPVLFTTLSVPFLPKLSKAVQQQIMLLVD